MHTFYLARSIGRGEGIPQTQEELGSSHTFVQKHSQSNSLAQLCLLHSVNPDRCFKQQTRSFILARLQRLEWSVLRAAIVLFICTIDQEGRMCGLF